MKAVRPKPCRSRRGLPGTVRVARRCAPRHWGRIGATDTRLGHTSKVSHRSASGKQMSQRDPMAVIGPATSALTTTFSRRKHRSTSEASEWSGVTLLSPTASLPRHSRRPSQQPTGPAVMRARQLHALQDAARMEPHYSTTPPRVLARRQAWSSWRPGSSKDDPPRLRVWEVETSRRIAELPSLGRRWRSASRRAETGL